MRRIADLKRDGARFLAVFCLTCVHLLALCQPASIDKPMNSGGARVSDDGMVNNGKDIMSRKLTLRRLGSEKYFDRTHPKFRTYDILAATAAKGCGPPAWANYMVNFTTMKEGQTDQAIEKFGLPPFVRYLYQFGSCLSDAQKEQILNGLTNRPQSVLGHGTLNHAAMQSTSWYLLAQYFPNARWVSRGENKTYTSKELMFAIKKNLFARTKRFYESGYEEWLSPTYAGINFFPMLNLYDFATDPELRQQASDEATLELAMLRAHSFYGQLVPPLTRINGGQSYDLNQRKTYAPPLTRHILWFYYGEPKIEATEEFESRRDPYYAVMIALSKWRPPVALQAMDPEKQGAYAIRSVTPSFSNWGDPSSPEVVGDSLIDPDYAIGTGNAVFDPRGYSGHIQTFSIMLRKNLPNQIECDDPYFYKLAEEDTWNADRWSPFQQTYRYDSSSVVMLFDIPKWDPWPGEKGNRNTEERLRRGPALPQLFQCRIPRNVDELILKKNLIFVRQSNVFVVIATLKGENEYDPAPQGLLSRFAIMKVRQPRSALFFRVEKAHQGYGFQQFMKSVVSRLPEYDDQKSAVGFRDENGVQTEVRFRLQQDTDGRRIRSFPAVSKKGKEVKMDLTTPIDAPFISLANGVLHLKSVAGDLKITH